MEHTSPMDYSYHLNIHDHFLQTTLSEDLQDTGGNHLSCPQIHWLWWYQASGLSTGWGQPVVCISHSLYPRILLAVQIEGGAGSMPWIHIISIQVEMNTILRQNSASRNFYPYCKNCKSALSNVFIEYTSQANFCDGVPLCLAEAEALFQGFVSS